VNFTLLLLRVALRRLHRRP